MDGYVVEVRIFRKGDPISPLNILRTDISYINISGCEIEEFVENTVDEDRLNVLGVEDE